MARPERTDVRARHSLLSGDHSSPVGTEGHNKLESYDFGAERKRLKSPDRCLFNRAKRVMDGCVLSLTLKRLRRLLWLSEKGEEGKCRSICTTNPRHGAEDRRCQINANLLLYRMFDWLHMNSDVGVGTKFFLESFLNSCCYCMSIFQCYLSVHA